MCPGPCGCQLTPGLHRLVPASPPGPPCARPGKRIPARLPACLPAGGSQSRRVATVVAASAVVQAATIPYQTAKAYLYRNPLVRPLSASDRRTC